MGQKLLKEQQFDFDFDLWIHDLKINLLGAYTVPSLGTFQGKGQKILSKQHFFFKDQQ